MSAGKRFQSWIEGLANAWKDRLRGWMMSWLKLGLNSLIDEVEPGLSLSVEAQLLQLRDDPNTPDAMKDLINKVTAPGHPLPMLLIIPIAILMFIPTIVSIFRPLGNLWEYKQERVSKTARFDPLSVITAWRRDPVTMAKWFDDLRDLGWNEERIDALKFFTEVIPNAADIVRFALREVYTFWETDPYGQKLDLPTGAYSDAAKAGLSEDMFQKYWFAHWNLPSAMEGFEMLHRNILTESQLRDLLKANDIMPFWRDQLIKLSWNIPTRVDVRRFWDMRTIDEPRLREIYTGLGYHAQDLEDYVLWTKIFVDFPDLLSRYKNGWLTLDQVRSELIAMGMKPERAATLIEEKVKKAAPERVAKERDLTAAEIIKGVKKKLLSWDEGLELLMDMGYDSNEAEFKLSIEIATSAGSPERFDEFKDLTQKWRLAAGMEGKSMTDEIKKLGSDVLKLSSEVDALRRLVKEESDKLVATEGLPETATARLRALQVTLHRAEAELARVQTDYKAKISEWRHGG